MAEVHLEGCDPGQKCVECYGCGCGAIPSTCTGPGCWTVEAQEQWRYEYGYSDD